MRIGFITQLLWPRYGDFWVKLAQGIGAEAVFADLERLEHTLADERLEPIDGVAFQVAAAQALALQEADMLVVPALNFGDESARGSGQDPWIASFPGALTSSFGGLPRVVAVPTSLALNVETLAVSFLHALTHDAATVRRVWERHRKLATPPKYPEPRWQRRAGERETVGLIGQPWLLADKLVSSLFESERHVVSQHQLEPAFLREEGRRLDDKLLGTDSEVLGAARLLGRRGTVSKLVMIVDRTSGADAWLLRRVERLTRKPLEVRYLDALMTPKELARMFLR